MKNQFLFTLILLMLSLVSCVKKDTIDSTTPSNPVSKTMKDLAIPTSFNFQTTKEVSLGILVKNSTEPLASIPVSVYLDYPGTLESPNVNARFAGTYLSLTDGRIDVKLTLPQGQDSLYLSTKFIGIESVSGFAISGTTASYTYGTGQNLKLAPLPQPVGNQTKAAVTYSLMGQYNAVGRPLYLVTPVNLIHKDFLNDVNSSLPENVKMSVTHPSFLSNTNKGDVQLREESDIYITFVSEGTRYQNAVGYYTYDLANPPVSASQIDKHWVIFPNASLPGSGGALQSGEKVLLGRFKAGVGIGWFLVANGWDGQSVTGQTIYYSEPSFNPEADATKRQHTILLHDEDRGLVLLGFEDLNRVTGKSDDDFNDAVFYVTTTPVKSIKSDDLPDIEKAKDSDGDGEIDSMDEFPNDASKAHTVYYPGLDQYSSFLVEDLWPSLGDFDFNDMVVDCNYKQVTNGQSNTIEMFIKLKVRAIGASYKNGFGIQFPIAPTAISTVALTDQTGTVKNIGVEAGTDKAVVIAFDNAFTLLPSTGGVGVNVVKGNGYSTPKDIELHIVFKTPQSVANLGAAPFNPFVTVNGDRTKEIHLAGAKPTSKANIALFGTGDDDTNPATGKYYKSTNNLVWMMEVPSSFQYAIEKSDISKVYLKFGAWAESGGILNTDWYMDKPGYRSNSLIYSK